MHCKHNGFHSITSRYDRSVGVLVYLCVCESCGRELREVGRLHYRPRFQPAGGARQPSPV